MKKLTSLILVTALMLGTFAGCGRSEDPEAYVPTGDALLMEGEDPAKLEPEREPQVVTLAWDPSRSMNPLIGNNISNRVLFSLMYQGLFAVSSDNESFPILCSHYQVSSDNRAYTYYIDNRARFSDGSPVTANDVLTSLETAKASKYYGGRFVQVIAMETVRDDSLGEEGVRITLNTAYQDFSMLMDIPILKANEVETDFPVGTGAYTFVERTNGAVLVRNPHWWCERPIPVRAETVALVEVDSQTELRDQFEFGDVSLAVANPLSDSYAEYRCDYELWNTDAGYFMYLGLNVLYSDYFKDGANMNLRKNLTYAIDRESIIENNFRGMAYPATLAASPGSPYYSSGLAEKYEYDDLKFIGNVGSFEPIKDEKHNVKKLRLLVNCDDSARLRTARDIAAALTNMGVPTGTLEYGGSTPTKYEDVLAAGNYEMYLGKTRLSRNMDLSPFFKGYGSLHYGGMTNDELYEMCRMSLADRGNYYDLHQMLAEDARIVPILFGYETVFAKRGEFDNLAPSRDNVFFYTLGRTMSDIQIKTDYGK